jgi:hypothetical protein
MHLRSLKLKYIAVGWLIFLVGAAWLLPPLDSRTATNALLRDLMLACCAVLAIATCIAALRHFKDAWSKADTVPNRGAYIAWISFETLAAVLVLAAVLLIIANTYAVRTEIRWFARSGEYKTRVLAQAIPASGGLKHIEWDGWGWAGQDTTVYLVFDPTDLLAPAAASDKPGEYEGLPCEVARVARLESHWYTVQMYTNGDCWRKISITLIIPQQLGVLFLMCTLGASL